VQIGAVLFGRGRTVRTRPGGSWDFPKLRVASMCCATSPGCRQGEN